VKFRLAVFCCWLLGSSLLGVLGGALLPARLAEEDAAVHLAALEQGLGGGISFAFLGGYRNLAANVVWISMYSDWQHQRKDEAMRKMRLASALRPESLYFWIDGARIIANDMPAWEVGLEGMERLQATQEGRKLRERYARYALDYLDRPPGALGERPRILAEKGMISWLKLDDLQAAADYFSRAAEHDAAPGYVVRLRVEVLVQLGRLSEAFDALARHYEALEGSAERSARPLVKLRLEQLATLMEESS